MQVAEFKNSDSMKIEESLETILEMKNPWIEES